MDMLAATDDDDVRGQISLFRKRQEANGIARYLSELLRPSDASEHCSSELPVYLRILRKGLWHV